MIRGKIRILELAFAGVILCVGCAHSPEQKQAKFLADGKKMMDKGDYRRAILEFNNALRAKPADAESHYQLALAYLKSRQPQEALRELRRALELNPKHSAAQLKLAEMMVMTRNPDLARQAEERLQRVLLDRPDDNDARFAMAAAEWQQGKPEDAEKYLREVLKKSPRNLRSSLGLAVIKIAAKDWKGAEEILRKAVAQDPKSTGAALALGIFYASNDRLPEAESQLHAAVAMDPKNPRALLNLAAAEQRMQKKDVAGPIYKQIAALPDKEYKAIYGAYLLQNGDVLRAVTEFEKVLKADPDDRLTRSRLVEAYVTANRPGDAERVLNSALKRNPKDLQALLDRSRIYIRQGKIAEANPDVTTALRYEPTSAQAHFLLAVIHKARGEALQERQELGETLRLKPDLLAARVELAGNLIQSNGGKAALATMNETPAAQKGLLPAIAWRNWALSVGDQAEFGKGVAEGLAKARIPEFLLQDATLKLQQKDFDGCRRVLDEYLQQSPEELRALRLLVQSYVAQNRRLAATQKLQEYVAQRPNSARLQQFMGTWLSENAQAPEARAAFEAAAKADPNFTAPKLALAKMDLTEGKPDAARQRLAAIVSANAQNNEARLLLAMAEEATGNYAAAIDQYQKLALADAHNALVMNNLAYLLAEFGQRPDEALKYAQQAEQMLPDNPTVEETLGWVCYRQGKYATAVEHLAHSVRKHATARRKYRLAVAYAKSGETRQGLQVFAEAFKMDPKLPEANMALRIFEEMKAEGRY